MNQIQGRPQTHGSTNAILVEFKDDADKGFQRKDPKKLTLKNTVAIPIIALSALSPTTSGAAVEVQAKLVNPQVIKPAARKSISEKVSLMLNEIEQVAFRYHATVMDIEKNVNGDDINALIQVSVDGKDSVVKKAISQLPFEVYLNMPLTVEGVSRGGIKKLIFKQAKPAKLSTETMAFLKTF